MENLHEPVKERRFQRISEALGNRTVRQVTRFFLLIISLFLL